MKYRGQIEGFPEALVNKMLDYQEKQGNVRNVKVFEKRVIRGFNLGAFDWVNTIEGHANWQKAIIDKDFDAVLKFNKIESDTKKLLLLAGKLATASEKVIKSNLVSLSENITDLVEVLADYNNAILKYKTVKKIIILLLFTTLSFSQKYTMKGFVVDAMNRRIAGAKIIFKSGDVFYAEFDGSFKIQTTICYSGFTVYAYEYKPTTIYYDFDNKTTLTFNNLILNK